ncbi:hypothetical protein QYM36_002333 [Artemia franciscana]|uniref:DUF4371 domain-containing protein n=1 Tax=Artemia franciscana TaxID=6661 RepID=A0AA88IB62_ARTSF|nr:hypothetical protein QYM36_002333 [Artemia franciscana]
MGLYGKYCRLFKTLYTGTKSSFQINGRRSPLFEMDTGFKAIETEAAESVASCLSKEREKEILENRQYVKALLKTTALLGRQGLAFRGHDEGESSANQGNFVETVHLLTEINPDLMKNSPQEVQHRRSMNNKVISTATSVKDSNPGRTLQHTPNPIQNDEYFRSFMNVLIANHLLLLQLI